MPLHFIFALALLPSCAHGGTAPSATTTPEPPPQVEVGELAGTRGLSCMIDAVEDGPNPQLVVANGAVTGLRIEYDIEGQTVAEHDAADFAASGADDAPLGIYTGTLDGAPTTLELDTRVKPELRFAHYRGRMTRRDNADAITCYRF